MGLPGPLVAFHRLNNEDSAGSWERFAEHRARVTALADGRGRLCVLGAGNGNDVELEQLARVFSEIHLVDLDEKALSRAAGRLTPEARARLILHAPVDLTGALKRLDAWKRTPPTPNQLAQLPDRSVEQVVSALPGPFDVVISTCLLTQLVRTCFVALGRGPRTTDVAASLALAHVRALVRLTAPGGRGVLVTDTISSETYPVEEMFAAHGGDVILADLAGRDAAFSATSPVTLGAILDNEGVAWRREPAWLWRFSEERVYLAYAVTFSRS